MIVWMIMWMIMVDESLFLSVDDGERFPQMQQPMRRNRMPNRSCEVFLNGHGSAAFLGETPLRQLTLVPIFSNSHLIGVFEWFVSMVFSMAFPGFFHDFSTFFHGFSRFFT